MRITNDSCEKGKEGLPAKVCADPEILILGTFPGEESLKAGEYYANKRNRFWAVLSKIYGESKPETKAQRDSLLERHHIALWDLFESADREKSLDKSIRNGVINDIAGFLKNIRRSKPYLSPAKRRGALL